MSLGRHEIELEGYKIWGEPVSWWQRTFSLFWQSSSSKYKVVFQAQTDITKPKRFAVRIQSANHETNASLFDLPPSKSGTTITDKTDELPLINSGDAALTVGVAGYSAQRAIYSFHVTDKSWLTLALIAGSIAGIFSVLGQLLIALLDR